MISRSSFAVHRAERPERDFEGAQIEASYIGLLSVTPYLDIRAVDSLRAGYSLRAVRSVRKTDAKL
jgi:hypothetical protein